MKYLLLAVLLVGCAAKQPAVLPPKIIVVTKTVTQPSRSADVVLSPKSEVGQALLAYRMAEKGVPKALNNPHASTTKIREVNTKEREAYEAMRALIRQDGHRTKDAMDRAYAAIRALMESQHIDNPDEPDATNVRQ